LNSDTYVILTQWQDRESFTNWKDSKEFKQAHETQKPEAGVNKQPHIFSSPSYVTTYNIPNEND
ncbi:MAG TPA: antibiotic biosynthesis monooxygenase, partial [Pseudobacillus sp.]